MAQGERKQEQGPCTKTRTTMITARGRTRKRRQEDNETTTTGVATTMVCRRVCDYHHYSPEEEERPTTIVTTTGGMAQGEGCHNDTTTRTTAMVTTMQDRLQERSLDKRTTTSSDYIIRLTDRLQDLRLRLFRFFSQNSRTAGPAGPGKVPQISLNSPVGPGIPQNSLKFPYCRPGSPKFFCCRPGGPGKFPYIPLNSLGVYPAPKFPELLSDFEIFMIWGVLRGQHTQKNPVFLSLGLFRKYQGKPQKQ